MQQETGTNEGGPKNGDNQEKIVFTIENWNEKEWPTLKYTFLMKSYTQE